MRKLTSILCGLMLLCCGCRESSDDIFTMVGITLSLPEGCHAERIHGTLILRNLNNREVFSSSRFIDGRCSIRIIRGAYAIEAEGSMLYIDSEGAECSAAYRAAEPYRALLADDERLTLDIIFL